MKRVYWAVGAFVVVVACSSAGRVVEDAGRVLMDAGRAMDSSANAQVGEWVDVVCDQERVATTVSDLQTTVQTLRYAIVDVDPVAIQVEACSSSISTYDADADGCADVLPDGVTCTSTGPLPETCSYNLGGSATSDGRAYFVCGISGTMTPGPSASPGAEPTHSETAYRIRYRTISF